MTQEALKLEWLEAPNHISYGKGMMEAIIQLGKDNSLHLYCPVEQIANVDKALRALHSENERLGLYKDAYAQPEQEPVAYYHPHKGFYFAKPTSVSAPTIVDFEPLALYTTPLQRTWVDLTPQDYAEIFRTARSVDYAARLAATKLKEKNT